MIATILHMSARRERLNVRGCVWAKMAEQVLEPVVGEAGMNADAGSLAAATEAPRGWEGGREPTEA